MLKLLRPIENAKVRSSSQMPPALLLSTAFSYFSHLSPSAPRSPMESADLADSVLQQKRTLRSKIRKDLRSLSLSQRRQEDAAIQNAVLDSSWYKSARRLCAYISCEALREVDTSRILSEFLNSSPDDDQRENMRKLYVPWVEDNNSNMRMLRISNMQDLIVNSMNILEPSPIDVHGNPREDVLLADEHIDIFILPGVAFDRSGRRLGRGGGYYDVFLKKYQEIATERKWRQPLLVALAYSAQIMDEDIIPVTSHDALIDTFVSPSGVCRISPLALERM